MQYLWSYFTQNIILQLVWLKVVFVFEKKKKIPIKKKIIKKHIFEFGNSNFVLRNLCSHCMHEQCSSHRLKCRKACVIEFRGYGQSYC